MSDVSHNVKRDGLRRLYGRAVGKPLSAKQSRLVAEVLPTMSVPPAPASPLGALETFDERWMEVGFGGGEHLLHMAKLYPNVGLIGLEPFLNGVAKVLTGVDKEGLDNIILHHGDARDVIDRMDNNCLDKLFVLFPDPWPKPRHFKRRILTADFIKQLGRVLKPGGEFRFASDIITYVDWTLDRVMADGGFTFTPSGSKDWLQPPTDWPGTRYEAKAFREGRVCHYFKFIKK